jgi:ankyrin repeat protein
MSGVAMKPAFVIGLISVLSVPAGAQKSPNEALLKLLDRSSAEALEVRALLARGADPNAASSAGGRSALMLAVGNGNLGAIRVLLAAGADANRRADSETPLCGCIGNSFGQTDDMALLLLAKGADPNLKCAQGNSPLRKALSYRSEDTVAILLNAGARVDDVTEYGGTLLIDAARYGPSRNVEQLLKRGASVNAKDRYGNTALLVAKNRTIAALLIKAGADINTRDEKGVSVLAHHEQIGNTQIAALLREHGGR